MTETKDHLKLAQTPDNTDAMAEALDRLARALDRLAEAVDRAAPKPASAPTEPKQKRSPW